MDVRGARVLLCLLVLVVAGCLVMPIPAASAATPTDGGAATQQMSIQEDDSPGDEPQEDGEDERLELEDANEVHIDVYLHENGSATFVVEYRFPLDEENASVEDWSELRDDIESNPEPYIEEEERNWNGVLEDAENETERDMELSNFNVSTDESTAPHEIGHVEFTFEWESFAHVELNRIEAGDALSGFTLVDDTTLQIFWPDSYSVYEVDPESSNRDGEEPVYWDGDGTEFTDDQPRLVLIENAEAVDDPAESEEGPAMPWLAVLGALALLVAIAAAGWWLRRRRSTEPISATRDRPERAAPESNGPPPELLSNEERVLRLLEERGGRVKQQQVVSELDWTEAKTSQVVSGLREDEEIEVFRIGRENVLALPDEETEE